MNLPVALKKLNNYEPSRVQETLLHLLAPLGDMKAFVKPGQKVLIKPNMLAGKDPEKAVTTHPEIVRQTILLVQKAGGIVSVGDSPGLGKPEIVARKCGIMDVIEETGAHFAHFDNSCSVSCDVGVFHNLEIAQDVLDADVIINLPKLKTHQMMGYTGAVKNLFGVVVGMRKARLHLQAGTDKAFFALMLLELAERISPILSIMDAVIAMEGNGPGSGDPVRLNAVLASPSPLALDTVATALISLPTDKVWTQKTAFETGRHGCKLEQIQIFGSPLTELRAPSFKQAKTTDINFGLPNPLKNLLKNAISAQPHISAECQLCGHCVDHCPPEAMNLGEKRVLIDYGRCIRCFCCQELCPYGAIMTKQGVLLRLADFIHRSH